MPQSILILCAAFLLAGVTWGQCPYFPAERIVACEGHTAHLKCVVGMITVQAAEYGRRDHHTCSANRPWSQLMNKNCGVATTKVVARSCNGRRTCDIRGINSMFGDPCYGTYKYLDVRYICMA